MKIHQIQKSENIKTGFKGIRVDRNVISQLTKNNPYSLTEPNQRRILNAIKNLALSNNPSNYEFLLDTAAQLKYSTHITSEYKPKNDWKTILLSSLAALASALGLSSMAHKNKIKDVQNSANLTDEEAEILQLKENLLAKVDLNQIKKEAFATEKDFTKNLDYFVISSETTLAHKKYVLERLNYLMSDEYSINPQLKDKKSIVAAEMVNDMAINAPDNKVPNIKAVNQKQHGMCAAISIVRKKIAYEDKPNYVDAILSELDSSDSVMVYDRNKLGSKEKVPVLKMTIDFDAAMKKGYRIIDASTMQWMHIAGMFGSSNISYSEYVPFDANNFDVNADSFFNAKFEDADLSNSQRYFQALLKANSVIQNYKAKSIKKDVENVAKYNSRNFNIQSLSDNISYIKDDIYKLKPEITVQELQKITSVLINMQKQASAQIDEHDKFSYIPNEEASVKKDKIKSLLMNNLQVNVIDEKVLEDLFANLSEYYATSEKLLQNDSQKEKLRKVQSLYDMAAAFRYQYIMSLNEYSTLEKIMIQNNIPDNETLLLNAVEQFTDKLKNYPQYEQEILDIFKTKISSDITTEEAALDVLGELKTTLSEMYNEGLDTIYHSLGLGSQKQQMLLNIEKCIENVSNKDKELIEFFNSVLHTKNTKIILSTLDKYKQKLINNEPGAATEVFNFLGFKNRMQYAAECYQEISETLQGEDARDIVLSIMEANGLKVEDGEQAFIDVMDKVKEAVNLYNQTVSYYTQILKLTDTEGNVIISANPKNIIIKNAENKGFILTAEKLKVLQEHLDKIQKDKSSDEFCSRIGKLKDKSLNKFSKQEQEILRSIEKDVNRMHSHVTRELYNLRRDMAPQLEELYRVIGLNTGHYWKNEGDSGLYNEQQIKVLEYITGRPHYNTRDLETAIENIKKSPYSGISSSSVYHNDHGWHAQYVADIAPTEIKITYPDGTIKNETREVLFHDNTWGACENENTWTDSQGLKRTDYSDKRGGKLGYIVNEQYRNGNLVDRILNDMPLKVEPEIVESKVYRKLKPADEEYNATQYTEIILDGATQQTKSIADSIHDSIFATSERLLPTLEQIAQQTNADELKAMITNVEGAGKIWRTEYDKIKKRIFAKDSKLKTQEDYDKLSSKDYLKVLMEKIALQKNYSIVGYQYSIAKVRDLGGLEHFKTIQKRQANDAFKYAFAKNIQIMDYVVDSYTDEDDKKIQKVLDKYNIKLTEDDFDKLTGAFSVDTNEFNGSAKLLIAGVMRNFSKRLNKFVDNKDARKEILAIISEFLNQNIYFNAEDINNSDIKHIVEFIDREFSPYADEEFVQIYRSIQDMTTDEFAKRILPLVKPEDLGIKNYTGYDMLQRIRMYDKSANNSLINNIYIDSIASELDIKDYNVKYRHKKFKRSPRYIMNYDFNDIYRELADTLSLLDYPKFFNKYKNKNIKQGYYPAYPKLEYLSKDMVDLSFKDIDEKITENVDAIQTFDAQIKSYTFIHNLEKYIQKLSQDTVLSDYQYKNINKIVAGIYDINAEDATMTAVADACKEIFELPKGTTWKEYLPYISVITSAIEKYERITPGKDLENLKLKKISELNNSMNMYANALIQKKYRDNFIHNVNEYKKALIKYDYEKADRLKNLLYNNFKDSHILNNPKEVLQSYIKSFSKTATSEQMYQTSYKNLLTRLITYAELTEIEDIIMDAISKGHETEVKNAFKDETVELGAMGELTMNSDDVITHMVNKLVVDNNMSTAIMFIEKLGLGESYVKNIAENLDYDSLKQNIETAHKIARNYKNFDNEVQEVFSEYINIIDDSGYNYANLINNLKHEIKDIGELYGISAQDYKIYNKVLDAVKARMKEAGNGITKSLLLKSYIAIANEGIVDSINQQINDKQKSLKSYGSIIDLINSIPLPSESEAAKQRKEVNEKYGELAIYCDSLPNLQPEEKSDNI